MAKILIIEDEAAISTLLRRIIGHMGHEVATAADGSQAQKLAIDESFDLILSDLHIPGSPSGINLLLEIREKKPALPIVVVSGYSTGDLIDQCAEAGIKDFLAKPFEMMSVRSLVDDILKRAQAHA